MLLTIWKEISFAAFLFTISECMTAGYNYMLIYLLRFLKDENASTQDGIIIVSAFCSTILISGVLRHYYIYVGYHMAIKIRKTLISSIYDKVASLSIRSMTETNSGKLITMVSSDISSIERSLAYAPTVFAAPLVAFVCFYLVKVITNSWTDAGICAGMWFLSVFMSLFTSICARKRQALNSFYSDGRMKLINDMVVGARTIKSYAWENHFYNKIKDQRKK